MIQGLALFCALIFWAGLAFLTRWTIRLHVMSKYHSPDQTSKDQEKLKNGIDITQITLQCCGPGTKILGAKAEMTFSLSSASFQSLFEDVLKMMNNRLSERKTHREAPSATHREVSLEDSRDLHISRVSGFQRIILKTIQLFRFLCTKWSTLKIMLGLRHKVKKMLHLMTRETEIQALRVNLRGGTGDAALTALLHGSLWMIWGNFVAHLNRRVRVTGQDFSLNIKPDFAWVGLDLDMISIVRLQMSHIMIKCVQFVRWVQKTL